MGNLENKDKMQESIVIVKSAKVNPFNQIVSPVSFNILDWTVRDGNGGSTVGNFFDDDGERIILRIPITGLVWKKSHPIHQKNITLLKKLLEQWPETFKGYLTLEDVDAKADTNAEHKEKSAELSAKIIEAKKADNASWLFGVATRIAPEASTMTLNVVYNFLLDKAVTSPDELNIIINDVDFTMKVNIAKAIEKSLIEVTYDGIYKINNTIISGSMDGLVLALKENDELYRGIVSRIENQNMSFGIPTRVEPKQSGAVTGGPVAESTKKVKADEKPSLTLMAVVAKYIVAGIFDKKGAFYSFNNIVLGQSNKEIAEFLIKNSSLKTEIENLYKQVDELEV